MSVSVYAEELLKTKEATRPPLEASASLAVELKNAEELALSEGEESPPGETDGNVVYIQNIQSLAKSERLLDQGSLSHIQGEFTQNQDMSGPGTYPVQTDNSIGVLYEEQVPSISSSDLAGANAAGDNARQWTALSNTGWKPPDTILAVGPNHVIEAVNSGFAVYTKAGVTLQDYTTFDNLMNKPNGFEGSMFDPRVIYDPTHARFLMLILGKDEMNFTSYVWVAISQTSDPTDGWCQWRWDVTDTTGDSTAWLDYASLGADSWGVYITGNYFYFSGGYRGALLQTINPDIFSSNCTGNTNGWTWNDLKWPSGSQVFTLQVAHPHSINSNEQTFIVNSLFGSGNKVLLWKLSGDRTNSPTLTKSEITTPSYNAIGSNVEQADSIESIDGGDARIMNALYANNRIFYTHTTDVNNDGRQSGWLTVKLNTDTNDKEWDHLLWSSNQYYFYPAITLNGSGANNSLALFGNWSASDRYASGILKIYTDQPNSSDGPFKLLNSGNAAYFNLDDGDKNRWGDYSGASYDWSCGFAWGAVEVADTNNNWKTIISANAFANESSTCLNPIQYTLTINKSGTGGGVVVSSPAGINCNSDCSEDYDAGSTITLTATPDSVSRFTGWSGACSGTGSCIVTMNASLAVTATFQNTCVQDAFEPDSSSSQATLMNSGTTLARSICPAGDEDWIKFTLNRSSEVSLETSGNNDDTRMWLYDNNLNEVEFNDDRGVGSLFSLIDRVCGTDALLAGTYYVKVDEFGGGIIDNYNTTLQIAACPDTHEPDDSSSQASIINSGTIQNHSIAPIGDTDWVSFTLAAPSSVTLETSGNNGDTRMWLYQSNLSQVEFNDDGGVNSFSLIDRTCDTDALLTGTYYVKVDEFGNDNIIDSYDLSLQASACANVCTLGPVILNDINYTGAQ